MSNMDNMFADMMFTVLQSNMSDLVERIIPDKLPKMKSVRTHEWIMDKELYAQTGDVASSMYPIPDGYNMEVSKLFVQVVNCINKSITNQNVKWAFDIIANYVPKPIKPKKPKVVKQVPEAFQINCNKCNTVKDIRVDFYKGRLICKKCFSKQVVKARSK